MAWTVDISAFAQKQLGKLDRQVARRILEWLDDRIEGSNRIGDFRLVCEIQDGRMVVLALSVGHRREIYRR